MPDSDPRHEQAIRRDVLSVQQAKSTNIIDAARDRLADDVPHLLAEVADLRHRYEQATRNWGGWQRDAELYERQRDAAQDRADAAVAARDAITQAVEKLRDEWNDEAHDGHGAYRELNARRAQQLDDVLALAAVRAAVPKEEPDG